MIINLFDIPQNDEKVGGGWSFLRNFKKGLETAGHRISDKNYDISMACGATMVQRDQWEAAKNKPRILRADGIPEDFRNRGTGWSRIRDYASSATAVIYQSEFSKRTTGRLLKREDGTVIMNGTDTKIFDVNGPSHAKFGNPSVMFVHYRNDPNKRFQEVIEKFRQFKIDNPEATMTFIGDYPKEQIRWGPKLDFGMLDLTEGKDWKFLGVLRQREDLAKYLRSGDMFAWPSFADPCPNTFIEALSCGLSPIWINKYGSSPEIWDLFKNKYDFSLTNMTNKYIETFGKLI